MNRLLFTALSLMVCAGVYAEVPLKVMTFNVRYGTALDGENAWPHRKDILIKTIRDQSPDLLGLQECLAMQADYIQAAFPEYRWFGIDRDVTGKGEMTCIFYRHADLYPVESGNFWLSETPEIPASISWDSSLTRIATWARFYHKESKSWIHYYNTHLDHRGEEARVQGITLISKRMAALPDGSVAILTGDFNASAEKSRAYEVAMEEGFTDAWIAAEKREGPEVTFTAFKTPNLDKKDRIDWILFKGSVRVSRCETITYSENGRYPSDHFPVCATLHIAVP
ncbi:MAG TPA: endonuclease/exonuclease/phosphatase family protein [Candidatus Hydrogenedentes bacterium]|jgi:endonuclease/exonuclease/phosphatase family metal-dependent hydrolase|nr:endonuclease/exonuclease/phosphatase family protein [Candidatus Hydrogenedentota bacterium]HOD95521.1 endonuclease/exonuclease/phosphatase family protein [Candidatus Hydrogenedentota bacterium]HOH42307.1 endonuclease/exonuclease/phosphatase family protein [Candidatus Hydrogenedentota bacterium]HOM47850.1 endonuclease/exonuclease/phosphatase family protein [Candidatus Hydrogenedentota bacterium]HOR51136.1 endonuclease/exonuclease/phosphatase family protein [Candidatus Hydrogenedentota bacteri